MPTGRPVSVRQFLTSRRGALQAMGAAAIGISLSGSLAGCGEQSGPNPKVAATGEKPQLNFYTWDTYIGDTTLADFTDASDISVNMSFFSNNDELFAKLRAGNPGYDVIVPSNDFVERMIKADMLSPIEQKLIPNFKNIAPEFRDVPFDPARKFSMPYTWLTTGIGYRKSKVKSVPDSWKLFYESDQYSNKIAMLSEAGDIFRIGAKYLGHSVNALTPEIIRQIEEMLTKQKSHIKAFHEDNGQDLLLSREVDLVMEFSGDIAQIMADDDDIGFAIPKEGSLRNSDNLCIPKGAPRPKNAHAFINYLLDAEVGGRITETIKYPTPNDAAKALMPKDYRDNPVIFPSAETLALCEYATFDEKLQPVLEEAFARIRAA